MLAFAKPATNLGTPTTDADTRGNGPVRTTSDAKAPHGVHPICSWKKETPTIPTFCDEFVPIDNVLSSNKMRPITIVSLSEKI